MKPVYVLEFFTAALLGATVAVRPPIDFEELAVSVAVGCVVAFLVNLELAASERPTATRWAARVGLGGIMGMVGQALGEAFGLTAPLTWVVAAGFGAISHKARPMAETFVDSWLMRFFGLGGKDDGGRPRK